MAEHRTYVLDTSVLLSDPRAVFRFAEQDVVVPLVVVSELEAKQDDGALGHSARTALWILDEVRGQFGRLDQPIRVTDVGGALRIITAEDADLLTQQLTPDNHDRQVLSVAAKLANAGENVCLVSKDLPLRIRAGALGIAAETYRAELAENTNWTGLGRMNITEPQMSKLLLHGDISLNDLNLSPAALEPFLAHQGLVLISPTGSALGRLRPDGTIKLVRPEQDAFGSRGQTVEQRLAIDALLDEEIGIVSLGGPPGSGKSALALSAALESVLERRQHRRIMVFRSHAPEGHDVSQSVLDTLASIVSKQIVDELTERDTLQVFPLSQIRGRALHDSFIIVDDAQALERNELLTVLEQMGQNSRVVFLHDVGKRLKLHVSKDDGITTVIEQLKGHPQFAHITLTGKQRHPIATLTQTLRQACEITGWAIV